MTTLFIEDEHKIQNDKLDQLLKSEELLDVLTDNILITNKGTLFDLKTDKVNNLLKEIVLYNILKVKLVSANGRHFLVCAVQHDIVVIMTLKELELSMEEIDATVGQSHIIQCEELCYDPTSSVILMSSAEMFEVTKKICS